MIKKIAHNPLFILLITANFLFASCSSDSSEDTATTAQAKTEQLKAEDLSGKELFKAIIFADGELASKIDFVKDHFDVLSTLKTEKEINAFYAAENEAISYLEKKDPLFFDNFKQAMLSKDPNVILKSLNETSIALIPLTNKKIAASGLTVEKIKSNPKLLSSAKVTSKEEACISIVFYMAYPGLLIAAFIPAAQANIELTEVDNNLLADELALSIAENI